METRKFKILFALIAIVMVMQVMLPTISYAVETMKLNIQRERPFNDDDGNEIVGDDVYTVIREADQTVFKIGEKTNTGLDFSKSLYCLRSGLGFGSTETILPDGVDYHKIAALKDAETVKAYYKDTIKYDIPDENYNAICYIADNMYLRNYEDAESIKTDLLNKAGIQSSKLTDDDIEVVQQMAIWYFSNNDEKGQSNSLALADSAELSNLLRVNENEASNDTSVAYNKDRANQIDILYKYLIKTAKDNQASYGTTNTREHVIIEPEIKLKKTAPTIIEKEIGGNDYYLVGPFEIQKTKGNIDYDLSATLKYKNTAGEEIPVTIDNASGTAYLADKNGDALNARKSEIKDTVAQGEFYVAAMKTTAIGLPMYEDMQEFTLSMTYSYKYAKTDASVWVAGETDQPVLLVEKEKKEGGRTTDITTSKINGEFSLQIQKVDEYGQPLTGAGFTLETNDRENIPLTNKQNGIFSTEKIAISENEEMFEYDLEETTVPEGYEGYTGKILIKVETGENVDKTKYEVKDAYFVDESGNKISLSGVSIEAEDNLITVKVENKKIRKFDLALRKYITKVNNKEVATRNPDINLDKLATGTTAEYKHRKDPVEVKTGNIVTYELTIYNEGDMDGRATKVTDRLPAGLKFVGVVQGNYEKESYDEGTNTLVLKEKTTNTDLKAYDSVNEVLDSTTIEIECEVTAQVQSKDRVLTNIAWISADYNAETKEDRDSQPGTHPTKTAEELNTEDIGYTGKDTYTKDQLAYNKYYEGQQDDDDFEKLIIKTKTFDLALRKYITKVNGTAVESRNPDINLDKLETGTTAEYKHKKNPVEIETGNIVTYKLTIYNEGDMDGRATKVTDQLPSGLKFERVVSENYEKESYDEATNTLVLKEKSGNENLKAYDKVNKVLDSTTIEIECKVTAKVQSKDRVLTNIAWISEDYNAETNTVTDRDSQPSTHPTKTAEELNTEDIGYTGKDTYTKDQLAGNKYYEGQQDDDDFEKLIIKTKTFDLSLRKYISVINDEELAGESSRVPAVDTTNLQNGKSTAKYIQPKDPITVKQGDIVTYRIRIYNEGQLNGYATEVTDYLPEGLGYIMNYKTNTENLWHVDGEDAKTVALVGENGLYKTEAEVKHLRLEDFADTESLADVNIVAGKAKISTTALSDSLIKAYGRTKAENDLKQVSINDENDGLFYQEVEVTCIVLAKNTCMDILRNIAEVSGDKAVDDNDNELSIEDRDSNPDDVDLNDYEFKEENSEYQEDDDDYEPIQLKIFDLALRKFITKVEDKEITSRIPEFYIDEDGNYKYRHDKTPIELANSDEVTYTIRIFNEGTIAGYAEEIEDDIPNGLVFLPENATNKEYAWKMYREALENEELEGKNTVEKDGKTYVETENAEEAKIIRTDYLAESKGQVGEDGVNSNLITAFNVNEMQAPTYKDVKVVFQVNEKNIAPDNDSRIITNKAQITEDSDDDEDSKPNEWNEGEDDQDIEHVYVKEFDLALFKWVTKSIVTVDGKTTTKETGFKPNIGKTEQSGKQYRKNSEPEPVAAVTVDKKKLNSTTVKFAYKIKVINEGEIAGYATEIKDYIPEGLKFDPKDNPLWTASKDGTISTRALETKLLQPGESTELEVIFTWINGEDNLGLKTNIAAITEDYNEKGAEDIDSKPGNEDVPKYDKEQEDDDDYALVILTLKTGAGVEYIGLILGVAAILASGTILIKKYVL